MSDCRLDCWEEDELPEEDPTVLEEIPEVELPEDVPNKLEEIPDDELPDVPDDVLDPGRITVKVGD